MTQNDGFVAVRTCRDDVDRRADQCFYTLDVRTGVFWQLFQGFGTHGRFSPARYFFVHRLQAYVAVSVGWRHFVAVCIFVANADVDGLRPTMKNRGKLRARKTFMNRKRFNVASNWGEFLLCGKFFFSFLPCLLTERRKRNTEIKNQ